MNDELAAISGKHEELVGILQEKFGIAEEEAKTQIAEFKRIIADLKKSNARLLKLKTKPRNGGRTSKTQKPKVTKKPVKRRSQ